MAISAPGHGLPSPSRRLGRVGRPLVGVGVGVVVPGPLPQQGVECGGISDKGSRQRLGRSPGRPVHLLGGVAVVLRQTDHRHRNHEETDAEESAELEFPGPRKQELDLWEFLPALPRNVLFGGGSLKQRPFNLNQNGKREDKEHHIRDDIQDSYRIRPAGPSQSPVIRKIWGRSMSRNLPRTRSCTTAREHVPGSGST